MSEYIYSSKGEPLANERGEISLPRCKIVRCMDCKFKRKSWNGKRPDFIPDGFFCAYWGGRELWKPDGFCAWGERRQP